MIRTKEGRNKRPYLRNGQLSGRGDLWKGGGGAEGRECQGNPWALSLPNRMDGGAIRRDKV